MKVWTVLVDKVWIILDTTLFVDTKVFSTENRTHLLALPFGPLGFLNLWYVTPLKQMKKCLPYISKQHCTRVKCATRLVDLFDLRKNSCIYCQGINHFSIISLCMNQPFAMLLFPDPPKSGIFSETTPFHHQMMSSLPPKRRRKWPKSPRSTDHEVERLSQRLSFSETVVRESGKTDGRFRSLTDKRSKWKNREPPYQIGNQQELFDQWTSNRRHFGRWSHTKLPGKCQVWRYFLTLIRNHIRTTSSNPPNLRSNSHQVGEWNLWRGPVWVCLSFHSHSQPSPSSNDNHEIVEINYHYNQSVRQDCENKKKRRRSSEDFRSCIISWMASRLFTWTEATPVGWCWSKVCSSLTTLILGMNWRMP